AAKPHYPQAHVNLGDAMRTLGRYDAAAAEYREALRREPAWADAHYGLAVSLGSLGDLAGAEHEYREVLRLEPDLSEAHFGLGLVLESRGMTREAVTELRAAERDQVPVAGEALAWLLATTDDPNLDDPLAAAYAASGRFAEAVTAAREAARLARDRGDARFAADVEQRLALYQSGRPVRSTARETPR